jgi:hypothetical protein
MRINPKLFEIPGEDQAFEVQEFDGRKIELFYMNDYEAVLNDSITKGKFSTWASVDGKNYRLFLEKGFYEALAPLYSAKVNKIWVEFWDVTEGISKKLTRFGTLPIGILAIILCLVAGYLGDIGNYVAMGGIGLAFIGMIVINGQIRKRVEKANIHSRGLIVKELGEEQFNSLLEKQNDYIDSYYANLYPEDEEELEDEQQTLETPAEEAKIIEEAEVVEEIEVIEETTEVTEE